MSEFALILLSGLSIGLIGSFHCVGMCGPLALSLPIHHFSALYKSISIGLYNIGRALAYTLMGLVFGLLGEGFVMFNFQQGLSIGAGIFILAVLLVNKFGNVNTNPFAKFTFSLKMKLGNYLKSDKKLITYLSIGFLNGFLPCGLVYIAVASAIATGNAFNSATLMFGFGMGTLPIMALTMVFGKFLSLNLRKKLNQSMPYMIMMVACLLIVRGLNLGIPYISPSHELNHVSCCHK